MDELSSNSKLGGYVSENNKYDMTRNEEMAAFIRGLMEITSSSSGGSISSLDDINFDSHVISSAAAGSVPYQKPSILRKAWRIKRHHVTGINSDPIVDELDVRGRRKASMKSFCMVTSRGVPFAMVALIGIPENSMIERECSAYGAKSNSDNHEVFEYKGRFAMNTVYFIGCGVNLNKNKFGASYSSVLTPRVITKDDSTDSSESSSHSEGEQQTSENESISESISGLDRVPSPARFFPLSSSSEEESESENSSSKSSSSTRYSTESCSSLSFSSQSNLETDGEPAWAITYDPNYLDNPELRTGKHRTVICLPSVVSSIIHYVDDSALKRELNEQFWQLHGHSEDNPADLCDLEKNTIRRRVHQSITLTQIRRIKQQLLEAAMNPAVDVDLATVARSYVYFEKLVLTGAVVKANRRIVAAACFLLAAKFADKRNRNWKTFVQWTCWHLMESDRSPLDAPSFEPLYATIYGSRHISAAASANQLVSDSNFDLSNEGETSKVADFSQYFPSVESESIPDPPAADSSVYSYKTLEFPLLPTSKSKVSVSAVFREEFAVFAGLGFALHIPPPHFLEHFDRIFASLTPDPYASLQEYLGDKMYRIWLYDSNRKRNRIKIRT